ITGYCLSLFVLACGGLGACATAVSSDETGLDGDAGTATDATTDARHDAHTAPVDGSMPDNFVDMPDNFVAPVEPNMPPVDTNKPPVDANMPDNFVAPVDANMPPIDAGGLMPPGQGDVLISEVMFNPSTAEPQTEWFEVYNTTSMQLLLSGVMIKDG